MQAKLQAQIMGLGVGFLPSTLAAEAIAQGRLVGLRVTAPKPRRELSVAWGTRNAGPATRWSVEQLQKIALA